MRKALAALCLGGAGLMAAPSPGRDIPPPPAPFLPPTPAPTIPPPLPPPPDEVAVPVPAPDAEPITAAEEAAEPPAPAIVLGNKGEEIRGGKYHDGLAHEGKVAVEVKEDAPNTLSVLMTGAAAAHCFVGSHSLGVQTFQVVQEFDIASDDPTLPGVVLTMESVLNGYLRTRHKGSACVKVARVSVAPAGAPAVPLAIAHPPLCLDGGCARLYKNEVKLPETAPMPLGRYVLVATFTIEAAAAGFLNGRGEANFSPDALPETWTQEGNPFKDEDPEGYGFGTTLVATAPGAPGAAVTIRPHPPHVRRTGPGGPAVASRRGARTSGGPVPPR